jgi:hypothetical protein
VITYENRQGWLEFIVAKGQICEEARPECLNAEKNAIPDFIKIN